MRECRASLTCDGTAEDTGNLEADSAGKMGRAGGRATRRHVHVRGASRRTQGPLGGPFIKPPALRAVADYI